MPGKRHCSKCKDQGRRTKDETKRVNAKQKLRGTSGTVPELTRFKVLWRDELPEKVRDFWREQFAGTSTQAEIRKLLKREHGVDLRRDAQLTEFRGWLEEQDARESEAQRQEEDGRQLAQLHPDWDADRLRTEVIASAMRRAIATGDFKGLGLKAVRAGQAEKQISLDRDKFELMRLKADKADATEQVLSNAAMTPEQRAQRIREIYGRA